MVILWPDIAESVNDIGLVHSQVRSIPRNRKGMVDKGWVMFILKRKGFPIVFIPEQLNLYFLTVVYSFREMYIDLRRRSI